MSEGPPKPPPSDSFPVPQQEPSSENFADLSSTISKLRIFAPIKMRRIDGMRQERARLLDVLQRDNQRDFLGPDRLYRVQEYHMTERGMVDEVLAGVTGANPITGKLWSEVLLGMGTHLAVGSRTQIYADLLDEIGRASCRERV